MGKSQQVLRCRRNNETVMKQFGDNAPIAAIMVNYCIAGRLEPVIGYKRILTCPKLEDTTDSR